MINQIRPGGPDGRSRDEAFPNEFGLPGEETLGPGGFACAVRTVPAPQPVWADVARLDLTGPPASEPTTRYLGMNHVGWYLPRSTAELADLARPAPPAGPAGCPRGPLSSPSRPRR